MSFRSKLFLKINRQMNFEKRKKNLNFDLQTSNLCLQCEFVVFFFFTSVSPFDLLPPLF